MTKIFKILASILILVVIALGVIISQIDVSDYKQDIITLVANETGRDFKIDGDIQLAISLIPTLIIEEVSFGNADWGASEPLLKAGRLEVEVSLIPLLSKTLVIKSLTLDDTQILLETNQEGIGNWVLAPIEDAINQPDSQSLVSSSELPSIAIDELRFSNIQLKYHDGVSGKQTDINIEEVSLQTSGSSEPMNLVLKASYNDIPVTMDGTLGAINLLTANSSYPINLNLFINDLAIGLNGKIQKPLAASGLDLQLTFQTSSMQNLSGIAESALPDIGPLQLTGKLSDGDDMYSVSPLSITLANSDLTGDVSVNLAGNRPKISATFTSKLIDLSIVNNNIEKKSEGSNNKVKVFSNEPLPLEMLSLVDADIKFTLNQIKDVSYSTTDTQLTMTINNGKLSINPLRANVAGGKMQIDLNFDTADKKLANFMANINLKQFQPGLLPNLKGKITNALTDITVTVNGSGNSVAAIMANINGHVLVKSGQGELTSEAANNASADILLKTYNKFNPTADNNEGLKLECFVINFDIADGMAVIDQQIALNTNKMNVIGSGTINFKTEELDLGVTTQAKEGIGINTSQFAELVRLKGTFANPAIATDTKAAIKAGVSAGAAIATGGLSLLAQGLFDKKTADKDPCATALGIKVAKATSSTADQSTTTKATEGIKDAGSAIKDGLKGLFGR